eukprot:COSAG02_NODE_2271_length_9264_cov_2.764539_1_plen_147_part_00
MGVCAVRLGRDRSESVNECDNLFSICLVYRTVLYTGSIHGSYTVLGTAVYLHRDELYGIYTFTFKKPTQESQCGGPGPRCSVFTAGRRRAATSHARARQEAAAPFSCVITLAWQHVHTAQVNSSYRLIWGWLGTEYCSTHFSAQRN